MPKKMHTTISRRTIQGSWRAEESEEAIDALNDAIELLTDLQSSEGADEDETEDKIQEAIGCLEEIQ